MNLALGPIERFTPDAPRRDPRDTQSDIQVTGAQVGSDWMHDLQSWWIAHRYYPEAAAMRGESGMVQIHMKVTRNGQVRSVDLMSPSGSVSLDAAAMGTFRGARLPPFPTNTPEDEADLTLTIQYNLIR
jgi:periplasmic protein TonB